MRPWKLLSWRVKPVYIYSTCSPRRVDHAVRQALLLLPSVLRHDPECADRKTLPCTAAGGKQTTGVSCRGSCSAREPGHCVSTLCYMSSVELVYAMLQPLHVLGRVGIRHAPTSASTRPASQSRVWSRRLSLAHIPVLSHFSE